MVNVDLTLNAKGFREAANDIGLIEREIEATRKEINQLNTNGGLVALGVGTQKLQLAAANFEALSDVIRETQRELTELNSLGVLDDRQTQRVKDLTLNITSLRNELSQLPRDLRERTTDTVGFLGDIDTGIQTFASSFSTAGTLFGGSALGRDLTKLGAGVGITGDIFAIAEQLPRLSGAIGTLKQNTTQYLAEAGRQVLLQRGLTDGAVEAASSLQLMSTGAASTALAFAPVVLAFSSLAVLGLTLNKVLSDASKNIDEIARSEDDRIDTIIKSREALRQLDAESARQQVADRRQELELNLEARDRLTAVFADNISQVDGFADRVETSISGLASLVGISTGSIGEAKDEINAYNKALSEQEKELARIKEILPSLIGEENAQIFTNIEKQRRDAALRTSEEIANISSEEAQDRIDQQERELAANLAYYDEINERIDSLFQELETTDTQSDRYKEINAELVELGAASDEASTSVFRNRQEIERLTSAVLPEVIAREKEIAAIEASEKALEDATSVRDKIAEDLNAINQQISDIEKQNASKRAVEQQKSLLKESQNARERTLLDRIELAKAQKQQQENNQKIIAIRRDGAEKEKEALSKFAAEETQSQIELNNEINEIQNEGLESQIEYQRERQKIIEDSERQITDAIAERDVVRAAQLKEQQEAELQQIDQQKSEEDRQRQERILDLRASFELERIERQNQLQATLSDVRAETIARINAQVESTRIVVDQVSQLEQELATLRTTFAQENAALQLKLEQDAQSQRLQALFAQRAELQRALIEANAVVINGGVALGSNAATGIFAGFNQRINELLLQRNNANIASVARNLPRFGFEKGGIISSPTVALMGELPGFNEALIPFRRSEGIEAALSRLGIGNDNSSPVNVYLNGQFGDNLNVDKLVNAITRGVSRIKGIAYG